MANIDDVLKLLEKSEESIERFKEKHNAHLEELHQRMDDFEAKKNRENLFGGKDDSAKDQTFWVQVDGKRLPVLGKSARLGSSAQRQIGDEEEFSIGNYVRDVMTGRKAASSTALVPTGVSSLVIDDVRAASTVVRAGAGTIVIDGPQNVAKITGDPTVYQHTEAAADISLSDITIAPVKLDPKALVAIVPLSMEVVADSPNLDQVLRVSLAAAFAGKLDALSLATILADTNIPHSAAGQDPAIWAKCLEAVGAALAANQPLPTSMIGNTADFIARASQLASTAGSWLGKPPVLSGMAELPTTKVTAGTAIYGGFERSFAIALRQQLTLEVIRFGNATSGLHHLVAHMRGDGLVLQPKGLFIQKKTV